MSDRGYKIIKELCGEGEHVCRFGVTSQYFEHYVIVPDGDIAYIDLGGCLEDTLHRLIDSGYEDEIYGILGAEKDADFDDDAVDIDLGYAIDGQILYMEK